MPLSYQISYSIYEGQPEDIVYEGRNAVTMFQLPAGDPDNDYKSKLHGATSYINKAEVHGILCNDIKMLGFIDKCDFIPIYM